MPASQKPPSVVTYEGEYRTSGEYAEALRAWMMQLHQVQCLSASFPLFLASLQAQIASQARHVGGSQSTCPTTATTPPPAQTQATAQQQQQQGQTRGSPTLPQRGQEYAIPPLWKRAVAELVDFFLLFLIKLVVTYAAVDTFDLFDMDKYDFENLSTDIISDYKVALNMTSEILMLELIHRIGTCVFEALCLHRGARGYGGATPGKKLMGLKVLRCEWMAPTLNDHALVFPATDLGLARAFLRSVVKNLSLTFLFPVCFTLFSFQHSRTLYDVISGSVVVEEARRQTRRNN